MVRDINDAIEILTESGARYFEIEGGGIKKKFEPEEDTHTNEAAVDQFSKDWERLLPGNYKITYRAKKAARQTAEHFRVVKMPDGAGVSGMGEVPYNINLQQQVWNLEKKIEIDALTRQFEDKLSKLQETQDGGGLDKFIAAINGINTMLKNPTIQAATVSGPRPAATVRPLPETQSRATPAPSADDEQNLVIEANTELMEQVYNTLGGDAEKTAEAFRELARIAKDSPEQFKTYLEMLKNF